MENKHILSSFDDDLKKLNDNLLKLGNGALTNFDSCINNFGTQGLNAMTISELSGVPRPTALRKLNNLIKRKLVKKDKNNLYLLFGVPKLDTNTIEKDVTLKTVRDINKSNEERFIRMLTKILNTIVFN